MEDRYQHGEVITQAALLDRGWSKKTVSLLGEPDLIRPNPHGRQSAPPMKLYQLKRVIEYESMFDNWRKNARRSNAGKAVAHKKRTELLAAVMQLEIHIPRLDPVKVRLDAIEHYNVRSGGEPFANINSSPDFLARITLNYIRHCLINYDRAVAALRGLVGKEEAYELLKSRAIQAAIHTYPEITSGNDQ